MIVCGTGLILLHMGLQINGASGTGSRTISKYKFSVNFTANGEQEEFHTGKAGRRLHPCSNLKHYYIRLYRWIICSAGGLACTSIRFNLICPFSVAVTPLLHPSVHLLLVAARRKKRMPSFLSSHPRRRLGHLQCRQQPPQKTTQHNTHSPIMFTFKMFAWLINTSEHFF